MMLVGVIDSGRGGLAVAKEIAKLDISIILLMDKSFFPYSNKSKEFLLKRSYYLCRHLINQKVDLIVLACNTLSVVALEFLKKSFKTPILGIFDYLVPHLNSKNLFIGSAHTVGYVKENYNIMAFFGKELIENIEKNIDCEEILAKYDLKYNFKNFNKLILGCTHFLNIKSSSYLVEVVSPIPYLLEDIKSYMTF